MDAEEIGLMIRFHRKQGGLTQKELAKLARVGKTAVFDAEKGKETMRLKTLLQIFAVLNIHLHFKSPLMEHFFREKS